MSSTVSLLLFWAALKQDSFGAYNQSYTFAQPAVQTARWVDWFIVSCDSASFVWASSSFYHCLAALDFGAGVEQPFGCFIVQNRQAVQFLGRSMDWTLEDDMVDGLCFCATLTGRRKGHTPFVQAGAETTDTGAEACSRTQALLGRVIPGVCVPVSGIKVRSLVGLSARVPLMIRPLRRTYVVVR